MINNVDVKGIEDLALKGGLKALLSGPRGWGGQNR